MTFSDARPSSPSLRSVERSRNSPSRMSNFRGELIAAGVLYPSGVPGVYGKGAKFVAVFDGVDRFVTEAGRVDAPEVLRFSSVYPLAQLARTAYLRSFPDLIGAIHAFDGDDADHEALLRSV